MHEILTAIREIKGTSSITDVEQGVDLGASANTPQQQAGTPQNPISQMMQQTATPTPVAPPPGVIKLACGTCGMHFGVPIGAKMVKCPHCKAVNNTEIATRSVQLT